MRFFAWAPASLFVLACSGSNNDTDSASGSCAIVHYDSVCLDCMQKNCGSVAATTLGNGWMSKDYSGGKCETMMACICQCSDSACGNDCEASASSVCEQAKLDFNSCALQSCGTNCGL